MTSVVTTRAELGASRTELPGPVGVVLTMGALHEGHAALLDAARAASRSVVVTVFVNPTQFGPNEDLTRYPRSLAADVELCREHGADVVWAPEVSGVYPDGDPRVTVDPGPLGAELEGSVRPGHFTGVLTVVAKLFGLARPDASFFGEKDYQQLTLIRQMVADLELGVEIVGVPTVREADGLARSSRNAYLSPEDRSRAAVLSRALFAGAGAGASGPDAVLAAARAELAREPSVDVDYLELRDADLGPTPGHGAARLLTAARVGTPRLIDNVAVTL